MRRLLGVVPLCQPIRACSGVPSAASGWPETEGRTQEFLKDERFLKRAAAAGHDSDPPPKIRRRRAGAPPVRRGRLPGCPGGTGLAQFAWLGICGDLDQGHRPREFRALPWRCLTGRHLATWRSCRCRGGGLRGIPPRRRRRVTSSERLHPPGCRYRHVLGTSPLLRRRRRHPRKRLDALPTIEIEIAHRRCGLGGRPPHGNACADRFESIAKIPRFGPGQSRGDHAGRGARERHRRRKIPLQVLSQDLDHPDPVVAGDRKSVV